MKTKKEIVQNMIDNTQEQIYTFETMASFLNRKLISSPTNHQETELLLGRTQKEIKEKTELLTFLQGYHKDLK
jgi:hypothetical protein